MRIDCMGMGRNVNVKSDSRPSLVDTEVLIKCEMIEIMHYVERVEKTKTS